MIRQAVCGIIFKGEQFLLIKRRDIPVWVLPGGGLDPGETPEEGVIRELYEETGYQVEIKRKIAEYIPANGLSHLTHFFECGVLSGQPSKGPETRDIGYFSLDALPKNLAPPYLGWIKDALLNQNALIHKKIEGTSYVDLLKFLFKRPILTIRFLLTKMGIHFNNRRD